MEQEEPQYHNPEEDIVADQKLLREQLEKFLEQEKRKEQARREYGYNEQARSEYRPPKRRHRFGHRGKHALEHKERQRCSQERRSLSPKKRDSSPVKPSRSEEESSSRSESPRRSHSPPRNKKEKEKEYIPPDAKNAPTPHGWQRSECPVGHRCNKALCYTHKRIQGAVWDRSRFPKPYYPRNKTRE